MGIDILYFLNFKVNDTTAFPSVYAYGVYAGKRITFFETIKLKKMFRIFSLLTLFTLVDVHFRNSNLCFKDILHGITYIKNQG